MRIEVEVEEMVFQFESLDHWIDTAADAFRAASLKSEHALCIDALGRICVCGADFRHAKEEGVYPIRVYAIPACRRLQSRAVVDWNRRQDEIERAYPLSQGKRWTIEEERGNTP